MNASSSESVLRLGFPGLYRVKLPCFAPVEEAVNLADFQRHLLSTDGDVSAIKLVPYKRFLTHWEIWVKSAGFL